MSVRNDLKLAINLAFARDIVRNLFNLCLFICSMDRPSKGHLSVLRDDLDVLSIHRHFRVNDSAANVGRDLDVGLVLVLVQRRLCHVVSITSIDSRVCSVDANGIVRWINMNSRRGAGIVRHHRLLYRDRHT